MKKLRSSAGPADLSGDGSPHCEAEEHEAKRAESCQ